MLTIGLTAGALLASFSAEAKKKQPEAPATATVRAEEPVIHATKAYRWQGDTIYQGPYKAFAPNDFEIVSDYHAAPGYRFPIEQQWKVRNDLTPYPVLTTTSTLQNAVFNMALDEMVNAIEPDSTLRTGREWPGVWTRDVSYSIILAMAALQPEASRISLEKKITPDGRIIQDTGTGGAWPVSSDRQIWTIAAYELYKTTGDYAWLEQIYPVAKRSLNDDYKAFYDSETGLVRGETSFIDWREQSYPRWMQPADIYASEALGTSVVHAQAWRVLAAMARRLGYDDEAAMYDRRANEIADAVNSHLWLNDKGYYAMYTYGRDNSIVNPRAETLGESLAILFDVATPSRAKIITEKTPVTPFGPAIFYPQIADQPSYHNNALWPFVAAYWTVANAKAGNADGVMEGFGSIYRPAALFATNKENFNLDNGDITTELNSSNMLWSLSGNLALTTRLLFGIEYEPDGIRFAPFIPKALADRRTLNGLHYRNATLNITVEGYGNRIRRFYLNGKMHDSFIPGDITGDNTIRIIMDDNPLAPLRVNRVDNARAPLTPVAWFSTDNAASGGSADNLLEWNPIEYAAYYEVVRDGAVIGQTRETSFNASVPGEYQVIAYNTDGIGSFASEPRSNRPVITAQFPREKTAPASSEMLSRPTSPVRGFTGTGFAETDRSTEAPEITIDVPQTGEYAISFRYANGNGPINTGNSAAIRTLTVDKSRVGTIVMPHRGTGNWDDWGWTNTLRTHLTAGRHTLRLSLEPENANMNPATNHALVDEVRLRRLRP